MKIITLKLLKYGTLIAIGLLLIYIQLPIGDYCSGLGSALLTFFLSGVLVILTLLWLIINTVQIFRKKAKFDFIPILLTAIFVSLGFFLISSRIGKFWTSIKLIANDEVYGTPKSGSLTLYENGSFGAAYHNADYSCTFQGNYEITDQTLFLKREDLTEVTDSVFTNEYRISLRDSSLVPVKPGFIELSIYKAD